MNRRTKKSCRSWLDRIIHITQFAAKLCARQNEIADRPCGNEEAADIERQLLVVSLSMKIACTHGAGLMIGKIIAEDVDDELLAEVCELAGITLSYARTAACCYRAYSSKYDLQHIEKWRPPFMIVRECMRCKNATLRRLLMERATVDEWTASRTRKAVSEVNSELAATPTLPFELLLGEEK